jgi:hypothetical protein
MKYKKTEVTETSRSKGEQDEKESFPLMKCMEFDFHSFLSYV